MKVIWIFAERWVFQKKSPLGFKQFVFIFFSNSMLPMNKWRVWLNLRKDIVWFTKPSARELKLKPPIIDMRNEEEMITLILNIAKNDERIRAVLLNGSRVNPNIKKDRFQD